MTLLAVCWGRYPLENAEGGYWGLMKCISDDEPPTPGPAFSEGLCNLVDACLRKDPNERLTALQLLKLPFITGNANNNNKVRNIPRTRRSSEGQVALGKVIKSANIGVNTMHGSEPYPLDEEEEDVKMAHLHLVLDRLQGRAIELEDAMLQGQASLLSENILTIRGSRFVEHDESKSIDRDDNSPSPMAHGNVVSLMLPSLKGPDINKWRHLATQLQLPLDVVIMTAKQRISERFLR